MLPLTILIFFAFLGLYPLHMEIPRLGVELELQLPAYTIATAMLDLSHICNLSCHLQPTEQGQDQTHICMATMLGS